MPILRTGGPGPLRRQSRYSDQESALLQMLGRLFEGGNPRRARQADPETGPGLGVKMAGTIREQQTRSDADRCALHGLSLPRSVLRALHKRGINCQPAVSLEHQHLANRYVLRGVESGGAVSDVGRA